MTTSKELSSLIDKGYFIFKEYFSSEEIDAIVATSKVELLEYPYTYSDSAKVLSIKVDTSKILDTVRKLTDTKFVDWHQKLYLKESFEGYLEPYHQDFFYREEAELPNHAYLQCFIAVDDLTECPLNVFESSHKLGLLEHVIGMERNGYSKYRIPTKLLKKYSYSFKPLHLQKGDMLIFDYLLIHGSSSNASPYRQSRIVVQLIKEGVKMTNSNEIFKKRKIAEYEILSNMIKDRKNINIIPLGYPK
jgi:ectoine hydroxylase-related dioxygenase (phytanoyl-CoA dioxygenase family)